MVYAIPAGIAIAASAWITCWISSKFDAENPPAWTGRRYAREIVSVLVMAMWMGSCLLAGEAFLLLEKGQEAPELFALGAGIAATGAFPAIFGVTRKKPRSTKKPPR